jgi:hypothetical protein
VEKWMVFVGSWGRVSALNWRENEKRENAKSGKKVTKNDEK